MVDNCKIKKAEIRNIISPLNVIEIIKNKYGCICQQYQYCFHYLLKAFNIKTRMFQLFTKKPPFTDEEKNIIKERYKNLLGDYPTQESFVNIYTYNTVTH